jgi:fermentation-respiration switch protein FrsA (DUF1100 family)
VADRRTDPAFLAKKKIGAVGLIGHSPGSASGDPPQGPTSDLVRTAVALSATAPNQAVHPAPRSLLLVHGADDSVLPASSSRYIYEIPSEPKKIVLLEGTGHMLDESADQVYSLVRQWLIEHLAARRRQIRSSTDRRSPRRRRYRRRTNSRSPRC